MNCVRSESSQLFKANQPYFIPNGSGIIGDGGAIGAGDNPGIPGIAGMDGSPGMPGIVCI